MKNLARPRLHQVRYETDYGTLGTEPLILKHP